MRKKPEYKQKVFRLEKELAERLEAYCKETGITQAHVFKKSLDAYLRVNEA